MNDARVVIAGGSRQEQNEIRARLQAIGITPDIAPIDGEDEHAARARLEVQVRELQKMETVARLAGGVAHDFNNLLTAILGYCELLLFQMDQADPARADVNEIREAAQRAAGLTRQLLTFSRGHTVHAQRLDANQIARGLQKTVARLVGEGIRTAWHATAEPLWVEIDPGYFEQAVLNLVLNARDAMPDGGDITIEVETGTLTADDGGAQAAVVVRVRDTGIGMTEDVRLHLFEPFFSTKPKGPGTGLGLSTVHGIVHQAGGTVRVGSTPGGGTTFDLVLPRKDPPPPETFAERSGRTKADACVLVVEDEPALRTLACHVLERDGYRVLSARDGREAVAIATSSDAPIDLLLTDVVMPEVNGRMLAERLQAVRPGLRVLYMSGYTDDLVSQLAPGEFLQKPFAPQGLLQAVRRALELAS